MSDVAGVAKEIVRALDAVDEDAVRSHLPGQPANAPVAQFVGTHWTPHLDELSGSGREVLDDVEVWGDPPAVKVKVRGDAGTTTVALGLDRDLRIQGWVIEPPAHGIRNVVIGSPIERMREVGDFYAALLRMRVIREDWLSLARDRRTKPFLAFGDGWSDTRPVRWPDPQFPQQLHLDVFVDDVDDATSAALAVGASVLDAARHTYADPVGHPFCLVEVPGATNDIGRIVFDGPDPSVLADFYAALLSMPRRVEDAGDRIVIARDDGVEAPMLAFQRSDSIAAAYPDPDHAAMLHLDLYFDDGEAATELALSLGATPLQRPWTPPDAPPSVFADPAGHPFCMGSPHRA